MSAPRKAWFVQPVRIRSERRLAAVSELNPAPGRVTGHREARGMGYRATTQVKGLSPEIPVIPVADAVHLAAGNTLRSVMQGAARPAGSETVARYQTDKSGTRETHDIPVRVWANKPLINGKAVQMVSWESDQLIVAMKQGNACGAKGLAGEPRSRDTSSGHGTGQRKSTKLASMTHSTEGEEVVLKSRMREICTSGSVRGLMMDSERSWS